MKSYGREASNKIANESLLMKEKMLENKAITEEEMLEKKAILMLFLDGKEIPEIKPQ